MEKSIPLPFLTVAGPSIPLSQIRTATMYTAAGCVVLAVLLHALYGTTEENRENIKLWVGGAGFIGTTLAVVWSIAGLLLLFHFAYYARLITVDLSTLVFLSRTFSRRLLTAVRRYDFVNAFAKNL